MTAHSEKELAAPTSKRGFGHHPLNALLDHGQDGPASRRWPSLVRRGNAGSNTAADHIEVSRSALRELPADNQRVHRGRSVLVRVDGAGSTHEPLDWLTARKLSYSVGFGLPDHIPKLLEKIPTSAWSPAPDADRALRDGVSGSPS